MGCTQSNMSSNKLINLVNYNIIIIADDSGSMNTICDKLGNTRWSQLRQNIIRLLDISNSANVEGFDIYFLNTGLTKNINTTQKVIDIFDRVPQGLTPITEVYKNVINSIEKSTIVLIFIDGQPNNIMSFMNILQNRNNPELSPTTIIACTHNTREINWLATLGTSISYLNIMGDYESEYLKYNKKLLPDEYVTKILTSNISHQYNVVTL